MYVSYLYNGNNRCSTPCMYWLLNSILLRVKLVVEAAAVATKAAAMSDKLKQMNPNMKHIDIIVCGVNVDIDSLTWYTHG